MRLRTKPHIRRARIPFGVFWECTADALPFHPISAIGATPKAAYEAWQTLWQFRPGNSYRL